MDNDVGKCWICRKHDSRANLCYYGRRVEHAACRRLYRHWLPVLDGLPSAKEYKLSIRFWKKVAIRSGEQCWEWQAYVNPDGYGMFKFKGKMPYAHRAVWELTNGPVPKGLCVCHKCDNRKCVNPSHLFLATHLGNMEDRESKNRVARGVNSGMAKLTDDQVREIRDLYRRRIYNQPELAIMFGLQNSTIHYIVNNKTWTHI